MVKQLISVEEVAKQFKLSTASVNYYTNLGLIVVSRRKGNKRLYDSKDVDRRIQKIRTMLNEGYTLRLIQKEFIQSDDF